MEPQLLAMPHILERVDIVRYMVAIWECNEAFTVVNTANENILVIERARVDSPDGPDYLGHACS